MLLNFLSGTITPEDKLYQLIIVRLDGNRINELSYRDHILKLAEKGIGGFMLSGGVREVVQPFIKSVQSHAPIPLFIASDIERGVGQQIRGTTTFPCQMAIAAAIDRHAPVDLTLLRQVLTIIASEAAVCGINMPIIPVLDVHQSPDNSIIGTRPFSNEPELKSWFDGEYIKILKQMGLFPAKRIVGSLFQEKFRHDGLVVTDDLTPPLPTLSPGGARECGYPAASCGESFGLNGPATFMDTGIDIILCPEDPESTVKELLHALEEGVIFEEQIDRALLRIQKARKKILSPPIVPVNYAYNEALSAQIAEKAITLVKGHGRFLPARESDNIPLIFAGNKEYFQTSPLRYYVKQASHVSQPLPIRDRPSMFLLFPGAKETTNLIPPSPYPLPRGARECGYPATCSRESFELKGTPDIEPEETERVKTLMKGASQSIVVSFGNPYVLNHFKEADILIAAYDTSSQAQDAVFKCISGESAFHGQLPVTLQLSGKGRGR
ncbi:MAG: hypothetical protein C0392_06135 [Syntrophus sp. (in: bacteria)]|nr:hypothetical protein [Syntrophus sp. (in: bacteria)]